MLPSPSLRTPLAVAALLGAALAAAPSSAQEPPPSPPQEALVPTALRPVRVLGPAEIAEWEEGDPVPYGYRPVKKIQKPLVIAGAVTFGSVYLTSALGGAIATDAGAPAGATLFVPVFGPSRAAGYALTPKGGPSGCTDGRVNPKGRASGWKTCRVEPKGRASGWKTRRGNPKG